MKAPQIDLIIERRDCVINLCEMKFCCEEFFIDKSFYLKVRERDKIVSEIAPKKAVIHNVLITTFGVKGVDILLFFPVFLQ